MEQILGEATSARVSVKATTNEGMGWIGRGEGIACIAVAQVARRLGVRDRWRGVSSGEDGLPAARPMSSWIDGGYGSTLTCGGPSPTSSSRCGCCTRQASSGRCAPTRRCGSGDLPSLGRLPGDRRRRRGDRAPARDRDPRRARLADLGAPAPALQRPRPRLRGDGDRPRRRGRGDGPQPPRLPRDDPGDGQARRLARSTSTRCSPVPSWSR